MQPVQLHGAYLDLTTPHVADACIRLGIPVRCAPPGTRPLWSGTHLVGRVCPTRHYGSVDVFLEAIEAFHPGDVLVVDNSGRLDEACVGDLVTLEASRAGLSGIVIWAMHRDTTELQIIRLPVFSLGALPAGPQRLDPQGSLALTSAACGQHIASADDFVVGDDDGVLFVPLNHAGDVADLASNIRDTECSQAAQMQLGTTFRSQSRFDEYLAARQSRPDLTFRQHLRSIGGAIEGNPIAHTSPIDEMGMQRSRSTCPSMRHPQTVEYVKCQPGEGSRCDGHAGRRPGVESFCGVHFADELSECGSTRRGVVSPPGEPDRDGGRVPDRQITHAGPGELVRGGFGGDSHGFTGGDDGQPLLDAVSLANDGSGIGRPQVGGGRPRRLAGGYRSTPKVGQHERVALRQGVVRSDHRDPGFGSDERLVEPVVIQRSTQDGDVGLTLEQTDGDRLSLDEGEGPTRMHCLPAAMDGGGEAAEH